MKGSASNSLARKSAGREQTGPQHNPNRVGQHGHRQGGGDEVRRVSPTDRGEEDPDPRDEREAPASAPQPVEASRLAFVHPTTAPC